MGNEHGKKRDVGALSSRPRPRALVPARIGGGHSGPVGRPTAAPRFGRHAAATSPMLHAGFTPVVVPLPSLSSPQSDLDLGLQRLPKTFDLSRPGMCWVRGSAAGASKQARCAHKGCRSGPVGRCSHSHCGARRSGPRLPQVRPRHWWADGASLARPQAQTQDGGPSCLTTLRTRSSEASTE